MLKVLQLIPTLDRSGAEKQMAMLARGLPRDRFQVEVAALTRSGPLEAELREAGIPVTIIGKPFKVDPFALARLVRFLKVGSFDVVQTWLFAANAYGRVASRLARSSRAPRPAATTVRAMPTVRATTGRVTPPRRATPMAVRTMAARITAATITAAQRATTATVAGSCRAPAQAIRSRASKSPGGRPPGLFTFLARVLTCGAGRGGRRARRAAADVAGPNLGSRHAKVRRRRP